MRRLRWAWAAAAVVGSAASVVGQEPPVVPAAGADCLPPLRLHHKPPVRPGTPVPVMPVDPTRPVDPKQPTDPTRPVDPTAPAAPVDPGTRAPEAGTQPALTLNPNMFGDQFGGTSNATALFRTRSIQFVLSGTASSPGRIILPQSNPPLQYFGTAGSSQFNPPFAGVVILEDNGRSVSFAAPVFQAGAVIPANTPAPVSIPVLENAAVTGAVQTLNPAATSVFYVSEFSTAVLQSATTGSGSPSIYHINQAYDLRIPIAVNLLVPSPAGGGVVGRTKLTDDNSPIPRDRLILGGDYFSGAALTQGGIDVTRISPGIEYTFFDRWTSVEVRAPFASTLDPNLALNAIGTRATQFGNVNVVLKGLLVRGSEFNLATGLGISLPTGPDVEVRGADGSDLLQVTNDSFLITPYLAALYTPGDRFFAQFWVSASVDPTGSRVFAGGNQVGRLYDQTLLSTDVQVGYWMVKNGPESTLRGFAPFAELHYNTTISDAGSVQVNEVNIGNQNNRFDELNLTLGASAQIGTNLLLTAGLVLPLKGGDGKFFDYQAGLRANWFFGPTAEARYLADATGGRIEPVGPGGSGGASAPGAMPGAAAPGGAAPQDLDPGTRAPEAGTQPALTLNPNMFGDFIGVNARTGGTSRYAQLPVAPRYNGFKLADGENARPTDRAFFTFNRYSDAAGGVNPDGLPELRLTRQIVGLESMIGDNASIGVRLPFLQLDGAPEAEVREIGDITVTGKYALYNNRPTGDVFSLGMSVTLPTGGRGPSVLADGTAPARATFFQPWAGGVWTSGSAFYQGLAAVVLPSDAIYPTAFFGSVGAGYWVYRNEHDALVRGIAPVVELHTNLPITNRRADSAITFSDQVNLTGGVYFALPKLTIGGALCVPLTGPVPYDMEAMLSVNYQF